jgi:hypothetical protein
MAQEYAGMASVWPSRRPATVTDDQVLAVVHACDHRRDEVLLRLLNPALSSSAQHMRGDHERLSPSPRYSGGGRTRPQRSLVVRGPAQ